MKPPREMTVWHDADEDAREPYNPWGMRFIVAWCAGCTALAAGLVGHWLGWW